VHARSIRHFALLFLLGLSLPVQAAPNPPADATAPHGGAASIELHVGIRDLVYIRQPLAELTKKFPAAKVAPFAGQEDAATVKIGEEGITCIAVGTPGDLKLASIGFNMVGTTDGMAETKYRTDKGIGAGSTVNDVLEAYGQPLEVLGEQPRGALKKTVPLDSPSLAKMYQYKNEDGTVKTFFLIKDHLVQRVVVNDLAPLDQHIVKGGPKK
jgi:hypothetical protein